MNFLIVTATLLLIAAGNAAAQSEERVVSYVGPSAFEIGTNATFGCVFAANSTMEYTGTWQLDNLQIAKVNTKKSFLYSTRPEFLKERFVLKPNEVEDLQNGRLMAEIQNVKVGDDREYTCLVEAGDTSVGTNFKLNVYKTPIIDVYNSNTTIFDMLSEDGNDTDSGVHVASCKAIGVYPMPKSMKFVVKGDPGKTFVVPMEDWVVDEQESGVYDVSGDLILVPTLEEHLNSYNCEIEMALDLGDKTTVVSDLKTSPLLINHPTSNVHLSISPNPVDDGKDVTFTCTSDGYPLESLSIQKLGNTDTIASGENNKATIGAKLKATRRTAGEYICTAANGVEHSATLSVNWHSQRLSLKDGNGDKVNTAEKIQIVPGQDLVITCEQEGFPAPKITWTMNNGVKHQGEKKSKISFEPLTVEDAGKYVCSSSVKGQASRTVILNAERKCNPEINKAVSQMEDGPLQLRILCTSSGSYPPCDIKIETDKVFNVEPKKVVKDNYKTWSYVGIEPADGIPQFFCTATNGLGSYTANVTVDDPEIIKTPQKSAGISPGIVVVIILLVTLVVIGIPYAYYRCCRNNSDDSGHVKGNQLDSVEVEKLEAVEQEFETLPYEEYQLDHRLNNPKPMRTFSIKSPRSPSPEQPPPPSTQQVEDED